MNIGKDLKKIVLLVMVVSLATGLASATLAIFAYSQYYVPPITPQWVSRLGRLKIDGNADVVLFEVEAYSTAHSANLIEAQAYTDTVVFSVSPSGDVLISGTLTISDTFAGDLNMSNAKIINIGDSGTDFDDSGGLTATYITSTNTIVVGDDIDVSGQATDIRVIDNTSAALAIKQGGNAYVSIQTTNDSEAVWIMKDLVVWNALEIQPAGLHDPDIVFLEGGGDWTIGTDDSDDNKFKINSATTLADPSDFEIDSSGNVELAGGLIVAGDLDVNDRMTVTIASASDVGLTVVGASSQSTYLMQILDDSGNELFNIWPTGHTNSIEGFRTVTPQYGPGLWLSLYGEGAPEHSNMVGSYDHTGGTYEQLLTVTAGDTFTESDATDGSWVLFAGTNLGATAEIKEYISSTEVVVDGLGWTSDISSQSLLVYAHPSFVSGAGGEHEFSVEAAGEFEIHSYAFTGSAVAEITNRAAADDIDALRIVVEGDGYDRQDGLKIEYETGDLQPADRGHAIHIAIDETGAVSSDATTDIDAIIVETTDGQDAAKHAIHVGVGFDTALVVEGGSARDMDYGYEVSSGSVVSRIDNYTDTASDIEIFDADNDYILIGSDNTFEIIAVEIEVGSSKSVDLAYYYSKAGDNWTVLPIHSDTTNGFQNSGNITFDAPGDWTKDDEAEVNGDITEAFYVKLMRQYDTLIATLPAEDRIRIFTDTAAGMSILGSGLVVLPYLSGLPADVVNGAIWMEADGLHVYYNGAEALVADGVP